MLAPISSTQITSGTIKTHGSETRTTAGHPALEGQADAKEPHAAQNLNTIGLSGTTVLSSINAVTATAASRTVLQLLAFAIAAQLGVARRSDEGLDAFFQRLAISITSMKDSDRSALEVRSGLKALNIRLTDLATALKSPEGNMAARIVAMAEAPRTPFAKAAAAVATSSYLQEGMGAPRSSETFSIQATVRSTDDRTGTAANDRAPAATAMVERDARSLQTKLMVMFEAGASQEPAIEAAQAEPIETMPAVIDAEHPESALTSEIEQPEVTAATVAANVDATDIDLADVDIPDLGVADVDFDAPGEGAAPQIAGADVSAVPAADIEAEAEPANVASAPIELPIETVVADADPLQVVATTSEAEPQVLRSNDVVAKPREAAHAATIEKLHEERIVEKAQIADRRLETLLTLKGFSEVVTAKSSLPDFIVSQPDPTDPRLRHALGEEPASAVISETLARIEKAVASATAAIQKHNVQMLQSVVEEDSTEAVIRQKAATEHAGASARSHPEPETHLPAKAVVQEIVPFAYASLPPAKEEFHAKGHDEDRRSSDDDDDNANGDEQQAETGDERRERLAKKAQDDLLNAEPEPPQSIAINRDSSESDRAYAQYQRMGGF